MILYTVVVFVFYLCLTKSYLFSGLTTAEAETTKRSK